MKTKEQIITEINAKMAEVFEIEEDIITPDAVIAEALELDSISLVDLVAIVHVDYKIQMTAEDLAGIKTFDDLYNFVVEHQP